jgi:hypothetical protein
MKNQSLHQIVQNLQILFARFPGFAAKQQGIVNQLSDHEKTS